MDNKIRRILENLIDDHNQSMERGTLKDWQKVLDQAIQEISALYKRGDK